MIREGRLHPGDKLPPERELADVFEVSRTSVRDAIRVLEMMGMVEPRQGEGTVVRDLSPDSLATPISSLLVRSSQYLAELLDVRKMLEPPLAARAAKHASDEDIIRLGAILNHQTEKVLGGGLAIEEDTEFHYTIATAARNSVVMRVVDVLMDLLRDSRERSLQVKGRLQKSLAGHRRIYDAIRARNPHAAEEAMRQHLQEIEEVILRQHDAVNAGRS